MTPNTSSTADTQPAVAVPLSVELREQQRRRLARIKRAIRRQTSGGVQELTVEVQADVMLLRGRCASFYCKQVAQTAAMNYLSGETLVNEIEVVARPR